MEMMGVEKYVIKNYMTHIKIVFPITYLNNTMNSILPMKHVIYSIR